MVESMIIEGPKNIPRRYGSTIAVRPTYSSPTSGTLAGEGLISDLLIGTIQVQFSPTQTVTMLME